MIIIYLGHIKYANVSVLLETYIKFDRKTILTAS